MSRTGNHEENLFNVAMQLPTPEARAAFLREACAGDEQLRQRVEALIAAAQPTNDFLEQAASGARTFLSASPGAAGSHSPPPEERTGKSKLPTPIPPGATIQISLDSLPVSEKPGDRIGHYKLLEQIGEGGCGVVYMAEQTEPIRRRVALKVIKLGMDTRSVVARFEAERQALALMDHPNIAKVLDAGATETGRPYFVMELVKGIKITEFCDQNKLSTKERLELFMQVCHAVQHAHQKGIIHRDIKPSNVMVCSHDGVPVPKVIDFGIAKATQQPLTDKTVFTAFGQFIGTPAYMSPEQAELSGLDIDTRTDIYALGVLLYELLTGKPPFEPETLMKAGLDEMRRIIRETEPPKPSTKLTQLVAADVRRLSAPGSQPSTLNSQPPDRASLRRLLQEIRGDLDWIVMKCLEKDRRRRYETATGLAHDIERHLNSEPVTAGAPGTAYRVGKFMRRHRAGLATVTVIALLLLVGVLVSTWQAVRAKRAEKQARMVANFLEDMLNSVRPEEAKGRDTTLLREILDKAAARVDKDLKDQPEVQASLLLTMGKAYLSLLEYDKAAAALTSAQQAYKAAFGNRCLGYVRSTIELSTAMSCLRKKEEAESLAREALNISRSVFGSDNTNVVSSLSRLAQAINYQGRFAEAENLGREAVAVARQALDKEPAGVAKSLHSLGSLLWLQHNPAAAEAALQESVAIYKRVLGETNLLVAASLEILARVLTDQDRLAEAEATLRDVLAMRKRLLGEVSLGVAVSLGDLAFVLERQGKLAEAERLQQEALAIKKRVLGNERLAVAQSLHALGRLFARQRKLAEAEAMHREALEMNRRLLGQEDTDLYGSLNELALVLEQNGKPTEAETTYRDALAMQRKLSGNENRGLTTLLDNFALLLQHQGKLAEAEALSREAVAIYRKLPSQEQLGLAGSLNNLAGLLQGQGRLEEAEAMLREALAIDRKHLGNDHPQVAVPLKGLALVLWKQGKLAEAEAVNREGVLAELRLANAKREGRDLEGVNVVLTKAVNEKPDTPWRYEARAFFLGQQGRWEAAAKDLSQAVKLERGTPAFALAPLLVETGDTAGYNNRRRIVSVTSWGEDPETAAEAAMEMSLLSKDSGWSEPDQLAETAVTRGTNHARLPYFQLVKGLVEYRQEHLDSAVGWAQKSMAGSGTNYTTAASAGAVLAMAQQQLKQPDVARKALAQATELSETKLPKLESGDLGENWPEWLIARILLREAKELMKNR
jgi:eukaryotic-like serine/threonine-protein kinase